MKFDWRNFTEEDYCKYIKKRNAGVFDCEDYIGSVHIGDISIDLVDFGEEEFLAYDFYVAHEDTGYGYKLGVPYDIPYDYADGSTVDIPYDLSYNEFKAKAEKLFMEYIEAYNGSYSLVEHANRPLEIW